MGDPSPYFRAASEPQVATTLTETPTHPTGDAAIDFDVLDTLLSFHMRAVTLALSRDLDRRMDGLPVARGTGKISSLLLIDVNPGIRASTLARLTMRDRAAVTRLIDGLVGAGLVERRPDAQEGRAQALHLTDAGRALAVTVRPMILEHSAGFFDDLSDAEVETLRNLLQRVYRRLVGLSPERVADPVSATRAGSKER